MTCYVETYQSWEVVTAGRVVRAYEPYIGPIDYETGSVIDGCYYYKCANGYAYNVSNWNCSKGHCGSNTWASGYPSCPHGDILRSSYYREARCNNDSGWDTPGYRAPCGRTTTKTEDQYGYVTRTHIGCRGITEY